MAIQISPPLIQSFKDNNGNPLVGGLLYTYVAGTSTAQTTFTDSTGATPNTNPIVLNSRGEASIYLTIGQTYKFVLYDAASTLIYSVDQLAPISPVGTPITLAASNITGAAASGANADITSLIGPVSTVNGQTLMHQNDIVNGNFVIAQAGTNFAAAVNNAYDLDGWLNTNSSAAVLGISQVVGSSPGRMARLVTVSTADQSVTAAKYVCDVNNIEGYNIEKYVGNTFTIAFRARVATAGVHCVALRNGITPDRSYIVEVNFPVANVTQNCSFTVINGLPLNGTWNYTNGVGLVINFVHMAGVNYQTSPNTWQSGAYLSTSNQVNDCTTAGNLWSMEKVTINLGTVAAVSEISIESELTRCLRYYQTITVGMRGSPLNSMAQTVNLSSVMRSAPTLTLSGSPTFTNVASETLSNLVNANNTTFSYSVAPTTASADTYVVNRIVIASARL